MSGTSDNERTALRYFSNMPMHQFETVRLGQLQTLQLSDSVIGKVASLVQDALVGGRSVSLEDLKKAMADASQSDVTLAQLASSSTKSA
jgi:hypothetical protein